MSSQVLQTGAQLIFHGNQSFFLTLLGKCYKSSQCSLMKFFDFEILLFHLFSQTWRLRQIIHLVGKKSDEKNGGCFLLAISFLEGSFCKSPGGNPLKRIPNPWAKVCDSGTYQTTISCFALPSVQNHWALVKRLSSLLPLKFLTARTAISPACCKVFQKASWIYAYVIVVCESNVFLSCLSKKWGSHAKLPRALQRMMNSVWRFP